MGEAPRHDELSLKTRLVELACILIAVGLLMVQVTRFAGAPRRFEWWTLPVVIAGMFAADFTSGLVHWFADTWGSETMPLLGRRLLRPFRVHHVNPEDFLRRNFVDTNGDVAMVTIPFLLPGLFLPMDFVMGRAITVFFLAMSVAALPTNQVHQWAHNPTPPRWVKRLQDWGAILSRREHARHHVSPYAMNYCIALGWCNGLLDAINFFRRAERVVTRLTGVPPRADDSAFSTAVALSARESVASRVSVDGNRSV